MTDLIPETPDVPERICTCGCEVTFVPYRPWQRFATETCRSTYYETHVRPAARSVKAVTTDNTEKNPRPWKDELGETVTDQ